MDHPGSDFSSDQSGKTDRLDSWKEIAAYLDRDVRTVRRWEKERNLPVHRYGRKDRGRVYAWEQEIDEWLTARHRTRPSPHWFLGFCPPALNPLLLGGTLILVGTLFWIGYSLLRDTSDKEQDWILVTDFENRSSENSLDGVIEYAVARELVESGVARVVPRVRIEDTLELMRLPADSRLDVALGLDIAAREPEIRAMVAGRIEALGDRYVLSAELLDARSGVAVAATSSENLFRSDVGSSIRLISDWAKEAVEASLPEVVPEPPLEQVTTRSLVALKLYSEAMALSLVGNWQILEDLLRQALEYDDEFASAHILLAHSLRNQRHPPDEYLPHAERAFAIADAVTDRERYFIRGSYYGMLGQNERAVREYYALTELYPNDFWGTNNLALTLNRLGRRDEAAVYYMRCADLQPNNLLWNATAATMLISLNRHSEAGEYFERAVALQPSVDNVGPAALSQLKFFPARGAWVEGNVLTVMEEADRIGATLDELGSSERAALAMLHGVLGQLEMAEQLLAGTRRERCAIDRAVLLFGRDSLEEDVDQLSSNGIVCGFHKALLLARTGRLVEAEESLESVMAAPRGGGEAYLPLISIVKGEIASARGNGQEAVELLSQALERVSASSSPQPAWYLAAETLASLLEDRGDVTGAVRVLSEWGSAEWSTVRQPVMFWTSESFRLRNRWNLAQLHRRAGSTVIAQQIEAELRDLLAYADEDHLIARQLRQLESSQVAAR
jgi:tetratricopeptide (TPR) repeat protein